MSLHQCLINHESKAIKDETIFCSCAVLHQSFEHSKPPQRGTGHYPNISFPDSSFTLLIGKALYFATLETVWWPSFIGICPAGFNALLKRISFTQKKNICLRKNNNNHLSTQNMCSILKEFYTYKP